MNKFFKIIVVLLIVLSSNNIFAETKGRISRVKNIDISNAYKPKALGLFVGIDEFKDPVWHRLKFPKKDVADISEFFTNNETISLDYKITLTEPENTTRDFILNQTLELFEMKNSSEEDMVIVYFSGHGTLAKEQVLVIEDGVQKSIPRKRPFIVTSDTQADKVSDSAIPLHKVIDWFDRLKSRRKVLILDMCHSGLGKSQLSPEQEKEINSSKGINFTPMKDSWASIILSACPMGGTSYEDEKLSNSVYTSFLLEGMKQGDLNTDGAITISEAHNYAIDKTRRYTYEHKGYKQVPTAYSRILGKNPIIVSGKPEKTGTPVLFSYASANQGVEVFVDKQYKGMLPKGMNINTGEHLIECKIDGKIVFTGKINFAPGFNYMLPGVLFNKKEKKSVLFLESGYRSYIRNGVSKDLTPDSVLAGFSIYRDSGYKDWLTLSAGVDVGHENELDQYSVRAGLKYSVFRDKFSFYSGPDLMYLNYKYTSETIGNKIVDREMQFFCPGLEALVSYEFYKDMTISSGIRSYYLLYKLNAESKSMISTQAFFNLGYNF